MENLGPAQVTMAAEMKDGQKMVKEMRREGKRVEIASELKVEFLHIFI